MRIKPLIFFFKAKYKSDFKNDKRTNYQVDMLVSILRTIRKDNKVKLWSEIEDKHFNERLKDNRTAEQIEEEVLGKFKNWAS